MQNNFFSTKANHDAMNSEAGDTVLHTVLRDRSYDGNFKTKIIIELIERNVVCLEATNHSSETPLHLACKFGLFRIVKYLCEQNANIYRQDINGFTALDLAIYYAKWRVVDYILNGFGKIFGNSINSKNIQLLLAAYKDDLNTIRFMERSGVDLRYQKFTNAFGETDLFIAIEFGCQRVARYLIKKRKFIERLFNNARQSPILKGFLSGRPEVVKILGDTSINKKVKSILKGLFDYAVRKCSWDNVDVVYETFNYKFNLDCSVFASTLAWAAENGKWNIIKRWACEHEKYKCSTGNCVGITLFRVVESFLIMHYFDSPIDLIEYLCDRIDEFNYINETFFYACARTSLEVVEVLANKNANLEYEWSGKTAIFSVAECIKSYQSERTCEVIKFLIDKKVKLENQEESILHIVACDDNYLDVVRHLDERNYDLETEDKDGNRAIHRAIRSYMAENVVKYLIERNVDLECRNNAGETPIVIAIKEERIYALRLLAERVNTNSEDFDGKTCLNMMIEIGWFKGIEYIVDKNRNLNYIDKQGRSVLHHAARKSYHGLHIFKFLAERYLNLEGIDYEGQTPLHLAAASDSLCIVKYLAEQNVDLECVDKNNETPLHLACVHNSKRVIDYFLSQNVNLNCINNSGLTPYETATQHEYSDLADTLYKEMFKSIHRRHKIYKSQIEDKILKNGETLICRIRDINGVHLLHYPMQLQCGHSICIDCILQKIGENHLNTLFCCLKFVRVLNECDFVDYFKNNPYKLFLNENTATIAKSYLNTLKSCSKIVLKEQKFYEEKLKFIEEKLEIRIESVKNKFDELKKNILNVIDVSKKNFKMLIKCKIIILNGYENYEKFDLLLNAQMQSCMSVKINIGVLKLNSLTYIRGGKKNSNTISRIDTVFFNEISDIPSNSLLSFKKVNLENYDEGRLERYNFMKEIDLIIKLIISPNDIKQFSSLLSNIKSTIVRGSDEKPKENDEYIKDYLNNVECRLYEKMNETDFIKRIIDDLAFIYQSVKT